MKLSGTTVVRMDLSIGLSDEVDDNMADALRTEAASKGHRLVGDPVRTQERPTEGCPSYVTWDYSVDTEPIPA